jgi:histone deacetylase 1/2
MDFDPNKTDMLTHINKLEHAATAVHDMAGFTIPDDIQMLIWLFSVKKPFGMLVQNIKLREKAPDINGLKQALLSYYEDFLLDKDKKGDDKATQDKALAVTTNANKNKKFGKKKPNNNNNNRSSNNECYYCFKPNHTRANCNIRKHDENNNVYRENTRVVVYGGQSRSRRDDRSSPPRQNRSYANVGYDIYESRGYERSRSNEKNNRKRPADHGSEERRSKRSRSDSRGESDDCLKIVLHDNTQYVLLTNHIKCYRSQSIALSCILDTTHCSTTTWILDSGATRHMTFDVNYFVSKKRMSGQIYVADRRSLEIEAIGTICLTFKSANKMISVELDDVYYVPQLEFNLLSIPHAVKSNKMTFLFQNPKYAIMRLPHRVEILAPLLHKCGLYYFEVVAKESNFVNLAVTDQMLIKWHERLGHPGRSAFREALKIYQIPITSTIKDFTCDTCMKSKSTRLPFPTIEKHTKRFLEKVCIDVAYMQTPSYRGYRYFVVLVDDYTSYTFVFYLHTRDEFKIQLARWYSEVTFRRGSTVNTIQMDRAGEFIDVDVKTFCFDKGIHIQYAQPRQHQQNGLAERKIRSLRDKQRTLLLSGEFPNALWAEALNTTVWLTNRLPAKRNKHYETPHQMRFGFHPPIVHLRRFGCVAWAHIDNPPSKLAARAIKCIFVGYPVDQKGYRLLALDTLQVIITRNVIFDENTLAILPPSANLIPPSYRDPNELAMGTNESILDSLFHHVQPSTELTKGGASIEREELGGNTKEGGKDRNDIEKTDSIGVVERPSVDSRIEESKETDKTQMEKLPSVDNIKFTESLSNQLREEKEKISQIRGKLTEAKLAAILREERELPTDHVELFLCLISRRVLPQNIPKTIEEAMQSLEKEYWLGATDSEMHSLIKNQTWRLVPRPLDRKVLKNKWVFVIKRKADGSIERYKARLVIKGFEEIFGIDYDDIYSPVLRFESLRFFLIFAAVLDYEIHQMDVKTAFLNGEIDKEIYMEQPPGYAKKGEETFVCLLQKSLYGLKQAPRIWNKLLTNKLKLLGFRQLYSDNCVFIRFKEGTLQIVTTYVDDLIIIAKDEAMINEIKQMLMHEFEMKDLGPIHYILGWKITRNRKDRTITISQQKYAEDILERFGYSECNSASIPMDPGVKLSKEMAPKTKKETLFMATKPYRAVVGSFMYLVMATRPDLAYFTHEMSKYVTDPGPKHWQVLKNGLRYLQGTKHFGLTLGGIIEKPEMSIKVRELVFKGHSDADFANSVDDRRSVAGIIVELWNSPIAWTSKIQPTIALSTTEAEYMALCRLTQEIFYFRKLCKEMNLKVKEPITLMEDNNSCIKISTNDELHQRTKHIDVKYHFIKDAIEKGIVEVHRVNSKENVADIFTKPLARIQFQRLRDQLRVHPT